MRFNHFIVLAIFGSVTALSAQQRGDRPLPSVREIRALLNDRTQRPGAQLLPFGERLFPGLEAILNDPAVTDHEALEVFGLLRDVKGDRSRFVEHAVRWLARPASWARCEALWLLGDIGNRKDTPAIVAQLWDSDPAVLQAALATLAKLGGDREQVAIDIWMQAKTKELRAAEQARDAIRKRVEEEKKKGG